MSLSIAEQQGYLHGVRVVELADELGEYCGKVLAGLGADVVKVEPPCGEGTRAIGPFFRDEPHPDRSLHFWHYNQGKRGVVLDLDAQADWAAFLQLLAGADVLLDTRPRDYLSDRGLTAEILADRFPRLVHARISPFGDDGPWADHKASDLVHLALGGVMMNCGYDADATGTYDTPPIAPQMWQSYHVAGEVTAIQAMAALLYRNETGRGQRLSTAVHDAVAKNTEIDIPDWVYLRQPHRRQTCAHSFAVTGDSDINLTRGPVSATIARTKDGRWLNPFWSALPGFATPVGALQAMLARYDSDFDLGEEKHQSWKDLQRPEVALHVNSILERFIGKFPFSRDLWKDAQALGLAWAPLRRPEENLDDPHWAARGTFKPVAYPELGITLPQVHAKWRCAEVPWRGDRRAPLLGEHSREILDTLTPAAAPSPVAPAAPRRLSKHGKPFALDGVKIVDMSWLLASGGAGRFFTALGAEVVRVEHESRIDALRRGVAVISAGGRAERDAAQAALTSKYTRSLNRGGAFMEINAGKRSLSLNVKHPKAMALLEDLIRQADIIIEGFAPGAMDRMGLGYERLRELNPRIVYVQQSGYGQEGVYPAMRSYGPSAQAFSGLSEMSGLPEPYAPAGIGYSYLDWFGAYQMAAAMMAGLYRQRATGQGCWIDSSQVEAGIYLSGTALLDHAANGRGWTRAGNRSPWKPAAPHGAFRVRGEDRWIAIAAFDDDQWRGLAEVLKLGAAAADPAFATLADRLGNQPRLEAVVDAATQAWDAYELMAALQARGIPAGVCQTAQDRCDNDPQLAHLGWQVELEQAEIGRWPVKEVPVKFSETPPYIGGPLDRHGPSYGQDNRAVLSGMLGLTDAEIDELEAEGAL